MRKRRKFMRACALALAFLLLAAPMFESFGSLGVVHAEESAGAETGPNLIQNGTFADGSGWGQNGNVEYAAGSALVHVGPAEGADWNPGIFQDGIALTAGVTYRFTMTVNAGIDRKIMVAEDPARVYKSVQSVAAGQDTVFTYDFTPAQSGSQKIYIYLGKMEGEEPYEAHDVTIKNVSLTAIGGGNEGNEGNGNEGSGNEGEGNEGGSTGDSGTGNTPVSDVKGNVLVNGVFAGAEGWGVNGQAVVENNQAVFTVNAGEGADWMPGLFQDGVNLAAETTYKVSVLLNASMDRQVMVGFDNGRKFMHTADVAAGEDTLVTYEFTTDGAENSQRFYLYLGRMEGQEPYAAHTVTVKSASVVAVTQGSTPVPVENNLLQNGIFADAGSWGVNGQVTFEDYKAVAVHTGGADWNPGIYQEGINLKAGTTYDVAYTVLSEVDRKVMTGFDNGRIFMNTAEVKAGEETVVSYSFTADTDQNNQKFYIYLGNMEGEAYANHSVQVSNVSIVAQAPVVQPPVETPSYDVQGENLLSGLKGLFDPEEWVAMEITKYGSNNFTYDITGYEGWQEWHTRAEQTGLTLEEGKNYVITYDITSSVDKTAVLHLEQITGEGSETTYTQLGHYCYSVKAGERTTITFMTGVMDKTVDNVRFYIGLGMPARDIPNNTPKGGVHFVTLQDISMFETTAGFEQAGYSAKSVNTNALPAPEVHNSGVVAVSENLEHNAVGRDMTLTFAENPEFAAAITGITVNGAALSKDKYTVTDKTIVLDKSIFTQAGTYKIQIAAGEFEAADVYQVVYAEDKWVLDWNDEFGGNSLDMTKWDYQLGDGSDYGVAGWGNNEQEYYRAENLTINNGVLTIEAKQQSYGGKPYTSGRIRTVTQSGEDLYATTYGKVEAKIKMPEGSGFWPAFWMLPATDTYTTWAASGEIDIMEARGRQPGVVDGTIHFGELWPNNKPDGGHYNFPEGEDITGYHVYAVEWDVDSITWYVDGHEYCTLTNWYSKGNGEPTNYAYPAPFDEPFYILLNLAVGGSYDGNVLPTGADFPASMEVDYVRVYKNADGYDTDNIKIPVIEKDTEAFESYICDEEGNFLADKNFDTVNTGAITDGNVNPESRDWYFLVGNYGGAASISKKKVDDKTYAAVNVTAGGSQNYAVQLLQHFPLAENYSYEISFDAYASKERDITVKAAGDGDNSWAAYSNAFTANLTTKPAHYSYQFTMGAKSDPTARLEFNMGLDTGTVYIANVKVTQTEIVTDNDGAKTPLENGNHVYNGSFTLGNDRLAYWHVEGGSGTGAGSDKKLALVPDAGSAKAYQMGIELLQSDTYELSFTAAGESGKIVSVKLTGKDGEYASEEFVLTGGTDKKAFTFTMPEGVGTDSAVLTFTVDGRTVLDDVSLIRKTNHNVDYSDIKVYPVANGDFEQGAAGWSTYGTDMGVLSEDGNQFGYATAGPSGNAWDKMLIYAGVSLTQGLTYEVSFRAKADVDNQTVEAKLENASYVATFAQKFTVGLEWQEYSYTFKSSLQGMADFKYLLAYADTQGRIYFDDLEIKVVGAEIGKAPAFASNGAVREGKRAIFTYGEDAGWEAAAKTVYVDGVQVPEHRVIWDTENNTLSLKALSFPGTGTHRVRLVAEGYDYIETEQTIIAADGSVLANGDFANGTDGWSFWAIEDAPGNACAELDVEDGKAHVAFKWAGHSEWGPATWTIQFSNQNVALVKGKEYILTFDASSTLDRSIEVWGKGAAETLLGSVELGGETGQYTIRFTADADLYEYIQFRLGTTADTMDAHDLYFDNVKLIAADEADVDMTPDDPDDVEDDKDSDDSETGEGSGTQTGNQTNSENQAGSSQTSSTGQGVSSSQDTQADGKERMHSPQDEVGEPWANRQRTQNGKQEETQEASDAGQGEAAGAEEVEEKADQSTKDNDTEDGGERKEIEEEETPLSNENLGGTAHHAVIWLVLGALAAAAVILFVIVRKSEKEE